MNSNFRYSEEVDGFDDVIFTQVGSFTTSFGTWNTMFDKIDPDNNYASEAFDQFKNNRFCDSTASSE